MCQGWVSAKWHEIISERTWYWIELTEEQEHPRRLSFVKRGQDAKIEKPAALVRESLDSILLDKHCAMCTRYNQGASTIQ